MSEFIDPALTEENDRLLEEAGGDIGLFYRLRALQGAKDLLSEDPNNQSYILTYNDMLTVIEEYKQGSQ